MKFRLELGRNLLDARQGRAGRAVGPIVFKQPLDALKQILGYAPARHDGVWFSLFWPRIRS